MPRTEQSILPMSGGYGAPVEDVFDRSGRPPTGWMNALFDGGPYGEDVGRCVPGPPPADSLDVQEVTYYLRTVGSWSDPENPTAVYGLTRTYGRQHPFSFIRHRLRELPLPVKVRLRRRFRKSR